MQLLFFWVIRVAQSTGDERLRESLDETIMGKPVQGMRTRTSKQSGALLEVLDQSPSTIYPLDG